jgi:nicotinate-nucleotide pyrophosphorylase (carboxylating)
MLIREIETFLEEDWGWTEGLIESLSGVRTKAVILVNEKGVVAGVEEAKAIFEYLGVDVRVLKEDGSDVAKGDVVIELEGDSAGILKGERVALNILGRMSGIATTTKKCVDMLASSKIKVSCTRKTTPGFRKFEKKAVRIGGGYPHRFSLSDAVLIKDNHLKLMNIEDAVNIAKRVAGPMMKVEVEVESCEECLRAVNAGADVIMFDNMNIEEIRRCIDMLKQKGLRGKVLLEASGNLTPENIRQYAELDLDFVSVGYIIHSSGFLDFSLEIIR